jgi:hypothetical protein
LVEGYEISHVDGAGRFRPQLIELPALDGYVAPLAPLVTQLDVVGINLLTRFLRHFLVTDPRPASFFQLMKMHAVIALGGKGLNRHVD